jgi:hypothetical protein
MMFAYEEDQDYLDLDAHDLVECQHAASKLMLRR